MSSISSVIEDQREAEINRRIAAIRANNAKKVDGCWVHISEASRDAFRNILEEINA